MSTKSIIKICSIFILGISQSCYYFATDYDQMLEGLYSNSVPLISSDSLNLLLKKEQLLILDTRTEKEYKISHIKNGAYLGYKDFDLKQLESIPHNQTIVVYCSVGYRSERIGEKLLKGGFTKVYNLYGGIFQWVNEDRPVFNLNKEQTDSIHAYSKSWGKWLEKGIKVYE